MKEFVEQLISRFKECANLNIEFYGGGRCSGKTFVLGYTKGIENAIKVVKDLAEEYNNGWIPVEERLPETNESVLCWAKSTARGGDVCFVGSCHNGFWFLQSSANTHSFPGQYKVIEWQPLPDKPYIPKEETQK